MKLESLHQRMERLKEEKRNLDLQIKEAFQKETARKKREINKFLDYLGIYRKIIDDDLAKQIFYGSAQETLELMQEPENNKEKLEVLKELGAFKIGKLEEQKKMEALKRKTSKEENLL